MPSVSDSESSVSNATAPPSSPGSDSSSSNSKSSGSARLRFPLAAAPRARFGLGELLRPSPPPLTLLRLVQ
eukprot:441386-Prymnesium_polylepis.1